MEVIRNAFERIPRSAWLPLGLIAAAILFASQNLATTARSRYESLFDSSVSLTKREVVQIDTALAQSTLSGHRILEGAISVPAGKRGEYLKAISDAKALPVSLRSADNKEPEDSIWLTHSTRKQRAREAREKQIAADLQMMTGVVRASVRFDQREVGFPKQISSTASVSLQLEPGQSLDSVQAESIRRMVASAWEGLRPDQVTVTDLLSSKTFSGDDAAPSIFAMQQRADDYWEEKIRRRLDYIPGLRIAVSVSLNWQASVGGQSADIAARSKQVSASIGVPRSHLAKYASETSSSQHEVELLTDIQNAVAAILPLSDGETPSIAVSSFDEKLVSIATEPASGSDALRHVRDYLPLVLVVAAFAIFGLSNRSRSRPLDVVHHPAPTQEPTEASTVDLKSELERTIRQNPDAAAEKLNQWLDKAG